MPPYGARGAGAAQHARLRPAHQGFASPPCPPLSCALAPPLPLPPHTNTHTHTPTRAPADCTPPGFLCDLLPACGPAPARPWVYPLCLELVAAARARPLVPGYYRLLEAALKLAQEGGMLDGGGGRGGGGAVPGLALLLADFLGELLQACRRYQVCFPGGKGRGGAAVAVAVAYVQGAGSGHLAHLLQVRTSAQAGAP